MATTTAKLTLSSSDLTSDSISLIPSNTLYDAATSTGMSKTTGLARYSTGGTSETKILESGDYTSDKAHKIYIKNTSTTRTEYIDVTIGTVDGSTKIGRLYAGEWAFMPWSGTADLNVTQSAASIVIEWMLIYE